MSIVNMWTRFNKLGIGKLNLLPRFLSSFFKDSCPELDDTDPDFPLLASLSLSEPLSDFLSSFLYDGCALHKKKTGV